jgi:hypothetical protein
MIKKLVYAMLKRRHFWRDANFDELSEIYVSMMFRSLAISMIGIFVPVFLLKSGYQFSDVAIFYIIFFATKSIMDTVAGYSVARFGPKHTILLSELFHISAAGTLAILPQYNLPIFVPALLWGAGNSLFYIAFHVDFSKVKHSLHGGKELGWLSIMERIGGTIGPLVGGILATVINSQFIFIVAILLLMLGLAPLFKTAEPTRTKQKLDFKGIKLSPLKRDLLSYAAITVERNLGVVLWPAFLTLFVFQDNIYATIGILSSISIVISIVASYTIGQLIDKKRGGYLLKISSIASAIIYVFKPFTRGVTMVLGINIAQEIATVGHRIPYYKGLYDAADSQPGHRIVYLVIMETVGNFAKLFFWIELYLLSLMFTEYQTIVVGFAMSAIAALLITTQRFKTLPYNH